MRADADMFADEFGSSTILAGKSVKSLLSDGPKGERDQVYEFIYTINTSLESMVTMDDIWRDTIVEKVQGILRERILNMLSDRKLFIEEMREKL
jgi:hypothetical protein